MCLNIFIPSLCVLCAKYFDPKGILIDNSILDDAFMLDSFLYYHFSYNDVHAGLGIILFGGRKIIGWSTWLGNNVLWVIHIFDLGKHFWTLEPLVTPLSCGLLKR